MPSDKIEGIREFSYTIRPYRPEDREQVRTLCCDLGFFGKPIENIFQDRKWFADFNTNYYLKHEPDSCYVIDVNNEVVGYVMGSRKHTKYNLIFYPLIAVPLFVRAAFKCITGAYDKKSRDYLKRLVFCGARDRSKRPKGAAHIHTNIKEGYRIRGAGKALYQSLFRHFYNHGITLVCSEVIHLESFRTERVYSFYRFKIYDKNPTAILGKEYKNAYLMTIVTNLEETRDFWKI